VISSLPARRRDPETGELLGEDALEDSEFQADFFEARRRPRLTVNGKVCACGPHTICAQGPGALSLQSGIGNMNASPGLPIGLVSMALVFMMAPGPLKALSLAMTYFVR